MRYGIRSPVLGVVNMIFAETGAKVSAGDIIIVIEAMKMSFEVVVPTDGQVDLQVQLGQTVDSGQLLAYINQ